MRGTVLFLLCSVMVMGCGSVPGAQSPATEGGPATATGAFGAQTVGGDQGSGQTPQTSTTGTATINWFFASQADGAILAEILAYAKEQEVKPDQLIALMSVLNGAPETVNITTGDIDAQSGSGEQTGATSGVGGTSGSGKNISTPKND